MSLWSGVVLSSPVGLVLVGPVGRRSSSGQSSWSVLIGPAIPVPIGWAGLVPVGLVGLVPVGLAGIRNFSSGAVGLPGGSKKMTIAIDPFLWGS